LQARRQRDGSFAYFHWCSLEYGDGLKRTVSFSCILKEKTNGWRILEKGYNGSPMFCRKKKVLARTFVT